MNKYKITKIINPETNKTEYLVSTLENKRWHPLVKETSYKDAKEFIKAQNPSNKDIPESIYF